MKELQNNVIEKKVEPEIQIAQTISDDNRTRILIVDDEPFVLGALKKELGKKYDIIGFIDPKDAMDNFKEHDFDLAILDIRMPNINGVDLAENIRLIDPTIPILFFTGYSDFRVVDWAFKNPQIYRISKPWITDLSILVERVVENQRQKSKYNILFRNILELLCIQEDINSKSAQKFKRVIGSLPTVDNVEIYQKSNKNKYLEIETNLSPNGLKHHLIDDLYKKNNPKVLKENGGWIWGIKINEFVMLIYLSNADEESHNYLQIIRKIFNIKNNLTTKKENTENTVNWLINLNRENIKNQLFRPFVHKTNNYLGAIIGYSDYALNIDSIDDIKNSIETTIQAAEKITQLIQKHKGFCNEWNLENKINLNETINQCLAIIGNELTEQNINLKIDIPENFCLNIPNQVVIQLIMNAYFLGLENIRDDDGTISITAQNTNKMNGLTIKWDGLIIAKEISNSIPEVGDYYSFRLYIMMKIVEKFGGVCDLSINNDNSISFEFNIENSINNCASKPE